MYKQLSLDVQADLPAASRTRPMQQGKVRRTDNVVQLQTKQNKLCTK